MAYTFKHGDRPLDDFTVQRAVGSGGFGEVYYALSDGGREVALKYLKANPEVELRGVGHCINLKSPHLVSIFDVKKNAEGEYFIVMEYCSGPSLRDLLIAEPKGFAPEKAAFFVRELAKGLGYLHDRGIVHRDLKPGNIFYDDGYVKIGDYGLSKFIAVSRRSAQTASVGTVHYMAPEIGSGNYSRGVDIYALGVILYEMLLGKVPFEGSSMAEILMKHLTAQPELDELPHSFGQVIRRALEKDPKDRFQDVSEMVDALLEADEVRESVAGFSVQSLDGAVRRGAAEPAASPVPSPNPVPRPARHGGAAPGRGWLGPAAGTALPDRLARKMDRISRKLERKLTKLGGAPDGPGRVPRHRARRHHLRPSATPAGEPAGSDVKRVILTIILGVGLAIALGGLVAVAANSDDFGGAAGLSVAAMSGAIALSRKASAWFGVVEGPKWASRFVRLGCAAPLLAIGASPMLSSLSSDMHANGLGIWLGMLAVAVLANWDKMLDRGVEDDISFGTTLWTAFGGLVATGIATGAAGGEPEETMLVGAGIAGVVSLIMQSTAWWTSRVRPRIVGRVADQGVPHGLGREGAIADNGPPFATPVTEAPPPRAYEKAELVSEAVAGGSYGLHPHLVRWGFTRAFWGIFAFLAMGGAIVTFLLSLILDMHHCATTGTIIGCVACFVVMLFAIRKTTPVKRETFWRESFRPFLMTVALFGIGASTTGIARNGGRLQDDELGGLITALVFSSLLLLVLLINWVFGGRQKRRRAKPFLEDYPESDEGLDATGNGVAAVDATPRDDWAADESGGVTEV